jgi:hypothetical protein
VGRLAQGGGGCKGRRRRVGCPSAPHRTQPAATPEIYQNFLLYRKYLLFYDNFYSVGKVEMRIVRLRLQNANMLRKTTRVMAFISRIFSLLTLLAVISILSVTLFTIDPSFFLGPSLSRKGNLLGINWGYSITSNGDTKELLNAQFLNFIYIFAIIPYAILFWALNEATKFFKIVGMDNLFHQNEPRYVRNLAFGGFLYCVTSYWMMPGISAVVSLISSTHYSFSASPIAMVFNIASVGHISVSWIGLLVLVCVGVLVVVAEIMRRASIIVEDYDTII